MEPIWATVTIGCRGPLPAVTTKSSLTVLYLRESGIEPAAVNTTGSSTDRLPNFLMFDRQASKSLLEMFV